MKKIFIISTMIFVLTGLTGCSKSNDLNEVLPIYEQEYAIVTEIVGNELTFKIGTPNETSQPDKQEEQEPIPSNDSAMMGEAQEAEPLTLTLTGEEEHVVIDAGIKIMAMGENGSLKDIKKGNIVQFERENNKVVRITVM